MKAVIAKGSSFEKIMLRNNLEYDRYNPELISKIENNPEFCARELPREYLKVVEIDSNYELERIPNYINYGFYGINNERFVEKHRVAQ